jgi:hypothetical protein
MGKIPPNPVKRIYPLFHGLRKLFFQYKILVKRKRNFKITIGIDCRPQSTTCCIQDIFCHSRIQIPAIKKLDGQILLIIYHNTIIFYNK